jgi:hypothetical protein
LKKSLFYIIINDVLHLHVLHGDALLLPFQYTSQPSIVKMNACKKATNNSIMPINTAKGTAIAEAKTVLNMKIKQIKLKHKNVTSSNVRK